MKLLVLYDNRAVSEEWVKGWGFSVLIENQDGESLLFDTGEKWSSLLKNMTAAKIDPMTIENLTFSHADWDHKGGAEGFLKVNREVNVFLPEFFPSDFKEILKNLGHAWEEVGTRPTELIKGVYATTSFYTEGKPAELGLVLKGSSGLSLVTGCAHPGIV